MSIILETYAGVAFFILLGLVFIWIFASIISSANAREDRYQHLSRLHHATAQQRSNEKQKILRQIGAPECPDGTYSDRQNSLWADYKMLDGYDKTLTAQAHNQMAEARGYLPDEIADIIEGKR